jgi:hypothetical protein
MAVQNEILYAFRIVHIRNVEHIAKYGICHQNSVNKNEHYVQIGDAAVIKTREQKCFIGNKSITSYIPFYFGPRSIMLYVIQSGYNGVPKVNPEDIVYCVVKLETIIAHNIPCFFTDGHALNRITKQYPATELVNINNILQYTDVYARNWIDENDLDKKRRKEAELLIEQDIPVELIAGYVVYNQVAKEKLLSIGIEPTKIVINPQYYF